VIIRPFSKARDYVHTLKLKNQEEWRVYSKSITNPPDIPATPEKVYRQEWKGMGDWLGTGRIANLNREYLPLKKQENMCVNLD
jgi:hypothetical protein